ncbi:uncharacterized protein PSFLO_01321 [Pseudozyma flocculosa]|uniref:Uncharacterized protein n=1 Tax=Pseudozyma flocculosa TaxID=84751 RepID=A0A5C3EVG9_9BASI|nr:uncharacterized protein PSFLO_01321 [Pseudozyma flocculosa]
MSSPAWPAREGRFLPPADAVCWGMEARTGRAGGQSSAHPPAPGKISIAASRRLLAGQASRAGREALGFSARPGHATNQRARRRLFDTTRPTLATTTTTTTTPLRPPQRSSAAPASDNGPLLPPSLPSSIFLGRFARRRSPKTKTKRASAVTRALPPDTRTSAAAAAPAAAAHPASVYRQSARFCFRAAPRSISGLVSPTSPGLDVAL